MENRNLNIGRKWPRWYENSERDMLGEMDEDEVASENSECITTYSSPPASPLTKSIVIVNTPKKIPSEDEDSDITSFSSPQPSKRKHRSIVAGCLSPGPSTMESCSAAPSSLPSSPQTHATQSSHASITSVASPTPSQLRAAKPTSRRKLAEQLKRTLVQYKGSLRTWEHTSRNGDEAVMDLLVERCIVMSNKGAGGGGNLFDMGGTILALCYHINFDNQIVPTVNSCRVPERHRWIIFKLRLCNDICERSLVKLYPPWQLIFLPAIGEEIIFCTDFHKISNSQELNLSWSIDLLLKITKSLVDDKIADVAYRPTSLPWEILIPYAFRNTRTISRQIDENPKSIELEVVICHVWTDQTNNAIRLLVKDSDNILTFIDAISKENAKTDLLRPGIFCRFNELFMVEKITPDIWLPLFSVLVAFNANQAQVDKYYYSLWYSVESSFEILPYLDIPFNGPNCQHATSIQLKQFPKTTDCRFNVVGNLKKKSSSEVILTDSDGTIQVRVLPTFGFSRVIFENQVTITFLRMFRGIGTLDQFSEIRNDFHSQLESS